MVSLAVCDGAESWSRMKPKDRDYPILVYILLEPYYVVPPSSTKIGPVTPWCEMAAHTSTPAGCTLSSNGVAVDLEPWPPAFQHFQLECDGIQV